MNSFYNYSGNVSRNWGLFNVSAGGGGARTALTDQAGTSNSSESYNGSVWVMAPSLQPPAATPKRRPGARDRGGSGRCSGAVADPAFRSGEPLRREELFLRGFQYAREEADSRSHLREVDQQHSSNSITSANQNSQYNALIQYQVRKLNFISGYARLEQGFSSTGSQPEVISSYYMGISRWFNFF